MTITLLPPTRTAVTAPLGMSTSISMMLGKDPFSGHVFCFRRRRGSLIKPLWWDGDGLCLFAKRLHGHALLGAWPDDSLRCPSDSGTSHRQTRLRSNRVPAPQPASLSWGQHPVNVMPRPLPAFAGHVRSFTPHARQRA